MMPATNQGTGGNVGFPDVCNTYVGTATSPLPYPNLGTDSLSIPFSPSVFVSGLPGHSQTAQPAMTNGDEAGSAHSSFIGQGGGTLGNLLVHTSGMPSEHLCTTSQGNKFNCPLDGKLMPSITNVFMSFRLSELAELAGEAPLLGATLRGERVTHLRAADRAAGLRRGDLLLGQESARLFLARADRELELELRRLPDWELQRRGAGATLVWRRLLAAHLPALREALARLRADGVTRLTLDLRGAPGGDLRAALALAAEFLPAGSPLLRLCTPQGAALARGGARRPWEVALRVRVDRDTASAAEGLALALRGRARRVGGPSAGKTWGAWLAPQATGLRPVPFRFA